MSAALSKCVTVKHWDITLSNKYQQRPNSKLKTKKFMTRTVNKDKTHSTWVIYHSFTEDLTFKRLNVQINMFITTSSISCGMKYVVYVTPMHCWCEFTICFFSCWVSLAGCIVKCRRICKIFEIFEKLTIFFFSNTRILWKFNLDHESDRYNLLFSMKSQLIFRESWTIRFVAFIYKCFIHLKSKCCQKTRTSFFV